MVVMSEHLTVKFAPELPDSVKKFDYSGSDIGKNHALLTSQVWMESPTIKLFSE
jgi:hypothetical protein